MPLSSARGCRARLELKDEGKVRIVGVSATLPHVFEQIDMGLFDAFQIPYSAVQLDHQTAIERASAAGARIIIRRGVARGVPTDWDSRHYYMVPTTAIRTVWDEACLDDLLDGMNRVDFLLRYTLSLPELDTTIVGTADIDHLRRNVTVATEGPLPERRCATSTPATLCGCRPRARSAEQLTWPTSSTHLTDREFAPVSCAAHATVALLSMTLSMSRSCHVMTGSDLERRSSFACNALARYGT